MPVDIDVVVIGGGQAGLATAYFLRRAGLDYLVLDSGLAKNTAQLFSLFVLANLVIVRNRLRSAHGSSPSRA